MKTVLVCPLDWGLGHASRDVEIIDNYLKQGYRVIIGADKAPLQFLRQYFPELEFVVIPFATINYSEKIPLVLKMIIQVPKLLYSIYREHKLLNIIIEQFNIDIVISDNRFGLWNKNAHSIFITHQLWVKVSKISLFERLANRLNHKFIKHYDECWIPDFEGNDSLAGELSHPKRLPENAKYIGILSRFKTDVYYHQQKYVNDSILSQKFDVIVIISGPEPQRSVFEDMVVEQLLKTNYQTLILQGRPEDNYHEVHQNIHYLNHIDSNTLKNLILKTDIVICRSGYSSIMDLIVLDKKAVLVPTPGQTEQEYLAKHLMNHKLFYIAKQTDFDLDYILSSFN